ncbi:MAG: GxxExxY protein [Solirubrobacterales bacterium]
MLNTKDAKGSKDTKMADQDDNLEFLGRQVVDGALRVHRELGPGLLESVYEQCLAHELTKREVSVQRQVCVPISYDGQVLDAPLKLDLLVGGAVVVEIKSVERLLPIHQAQLLTYLRLSQRPVGFLINFNVTLIKEGIRRFVL